MNNLKKNRSKFTLTIFISVCVMNFFLFLDRGIIPGAAQEFNAFISTTLDTSSPDVYLGLLQSSFIIGFVVGSIVFGRLIHHYGRFYITVAGCVLWLLAVTFAGISKSFNSYQFLAFTRSISGFGEAGMQCVVPPWIEKEAPKSLKGLWLSLFYTAVPVGTAAGYAFSSIIAKELGWQWCFFIEGITMTPFVIYIYSISSYYPCERYENDSEDPIEDVNSSLLPSTASNDDLEHDLEGTEYNSLHDRNDNKISTSIRKSKDELINNDNISNKSNIVNPPTLYEELVFILSRPVYVSLILGYAAQSGALIGFSTFGSSFMLALGYFDSESDSSTVTGALISIAGMIGTPVGGWLIDQYTNNLTKSKSPSRSNSFNDGKKEMIIQGEYVIVDENDETKGYEHNEDDYKTRKQQNLTINDDNKETNRLKIINVSKVLIIGSLVGGTLLVLLFFVYNEGLFLFMLTIGCCLIFITIPGINLAVMLSIPPDNRALGVGIMCVVLHMFGDVPSPIIVGYLKDILAPKCVPDNGDDTISSSPECRSQGDSIRICILLVTLWFLWTVFFFSITYVLALANVQSMFRKNSSAPYDKSKSCLSIIHQCFGMQDKHELLWRRRKHSQSSSYRNSVTLPTIIEDENDHEQENKR
eukprot:gene9541-12851_t